MPDINNRVNLDLNLIKEINKSDVTCLTIEKGKLKKTYNISKKSTLEDVVNYIQAEILQLAPKDVLRYKSEFGQELKKLAIKDLNKEVIQNKKNSQLEIQKINVALKKLDVEIVPKEISPQTFIQSQTRKTLEEGIANLKKQGSSPFIPPRTPLTAKVLTPEERVDQEILFCLKSIKKIVNEEIISANYMIKSKKWRNEPFTWMTCQMLKDGRIELSTKLKAQREKDKDTYNAYDFRNLFYEAELTAKTASHSKLGNCDEKAQYILFYLMERLDPSIKIDVFRIENGDHVFLVIGRPWDSDPKDDRTWKDAYVLDPWSETFFPASDIRKRLEDFTGMRIDERPEKVRFDPNFQTLKLFVSNLYSEQEYLNDSTKPLSVSNARLLAFLKEFHQADSMKKIHVAKKIVAESKLMNLEPCSKTLVSQMQYFIEIHEKEVRFSPKKKFKLKKNSSNEIEGDNIERFLKKHSKESVVSDLGPSLVHQKISLNRSNEEIKNAIDQLIDEPHPIKTRQQNAEGLFITALKANNEAIVDYLLDKGININNPYLIPFLLKTSFSSIIEGKLINRFIQDGGDVNSEDYENTFSSLVIANDQFEHLPFLLEKGADFSMKKAGLSLFTRVIASKKLPNDLLKKAIDNMIAAGFDLNRDIFFNAAIINKNQEIADYLLDNGNDPPRAALVAIFESLFSFTDEFVEKTTKKFIDSGGDINLKSWGRSILGYAVVDGNERIIEFLIKNGADPLDGDTPQDTGLFLAISKESSSAWVKEAIDKMMNSTSLDSAKKESYIETMMTTAIQSNNETIVHYLLDKGVDPNMNTPNGPFLLVAMHQGLSTPLLKKFIDQMVLKGGDLNANSYFKEALENKNEEIANYLLEKGVKASPYFLLNAFEQQVHNNQLLENLIKGIVKNKEDLNFKPWRFSALGYAISDNNEEIIDLLIKNGADPLLGDNIGAKPLVRAIGLGLSSAWIKDNIDQIIDSSTLDSATKDSYIKAFLTEGIKGKNENIINYLSDKGFDPKDVS